ncbi:MAG: hypothetical protein KBD44_01625 [Candidatus Pacebacteria bacterium]|nr:hypothetical protein [Candidatus Paceibacterota bacterium]
MNVSDAASDLVKSFYGRNETYLTGVDWCENTESLTASFAIPVSAVYSVYPLMYVTAEQYTRCVAQGSYAFGYCLEARRGALTSAYFVECMRGGRMWFRELSFKFRKQLPKPAEFDLKFTLSASRDVHGFTFASFLATNEALQAKCTLVVPSENRTAGSK